MAGKLYLVTTPIGNLEDITLRALEVLKKVDLVAAEDTRRTRQLLSHFGIHARLESFHAFNEHEKARPLLEKVLRDGLSAALVSDAGTPSVADPGFLLVREALAAGIEPVVVPGVSALTFAVTASGLPVDRFSFRGFVPVKPGKRRRFLESVAADGGTTFFFESPYRIGKLLTEIAEVVSPECRVVLVREATKLHEEVLRGSAAELAALPREWRGEFVVGVRPPEPRGGEASDDDEEVPELRRN